MILQLVDIGAIVYDNREIKKHTILLDLLPQLIKQFPFKFDVFFVPRIALVSVCLIAQRVARQIALIVVDGFYQNRIEFSAKNEELALKVQQIEQVQIAEPTKNGFYLVAVHS